MSINIQEYLVNNIRRISIEDKVSNRIIAKLRISTKDVLEYCRDIIKSGTNSRESTQNYYVSNDKLEIAIGKMNLEIVSVKKLK